MKKLSRFVASVLAVVLCFSSLATGASAAVSAADAESSVSFAQEFANPTNNDYKPGIRYWFSPGLMNEAQTRKEIRNFADMGYGHVELISLEQTTVQMNSKEWNDVMYWILDEAVKVGIRIDVTLGEFWPIATEAIPKDEAYTSTAAEQKLSVGAVSFTASEGNMVYSEETFANPSYQTSSWWGTQTVYTYDASHPFTLVAVTAAKKNADGTYDPDSAVVLTDLVNQETGAVSWTAPSEGDWSIFWSYQQNTGKILSYGVDATVVDHMSLEGTQAVINDFEQGFDNYEKETGIDLRELYKKAGGDFFGDSFELSSCTMWTWDFLQEFQARRGYDLTPYLPTIWNSSSYNDASVARTYEFDGIGEKVRNDYGLTVSELIAERHLAVFNEWAETLDMNLRYQVHSSSGALLIDETVGALATDTPETESYALGNSLDSYRSKSAAATLMNSRYGAEAAAEGNMAWVQTWTGSTGSKTDHGLMYFTNRLFAGGVNELTLHGATYQLEGTLPDIVAGSFMPGNPTFTVTFPGYSLMQGMNYPNDWANSTPLYTYSHEMLAYLARTQMVLQQGKADLDLAVYRLFTTPSTREAAPSDLNLDGYTYEYVTDTILKQDKAVVGQQNGQTVLAPEGAAYQALVIDQRNTSAGTEAFSMPVSTAKTILSYAKAGLPVFIVGEAPSTSATLADNDAELVAVMNELKEVATCVATAADLDAALRNAGVTPDADPAQNNATMFYHRVDNDVNYYFMANDSTENTENLTLTLQGEGQPYVLDAWSGEITPVAEYTTSDGTVTLNVSLAPSEQALIAVAEDGWFGTVETVDHAVASDADELFFQNAELLAKTVNGGEHTVQLSNGETKTFIAAAPEAASIDSWSLVVHKWLPIDLTDESVSPWQHQVVDSDTYTIANTDEAMVGWANTDPDNLTKVMGVGDYTTTFTLEKGWAEGQGAYLTFQDVSDTMGLTVNGHKVAVNQIAKNADIGPWLVAGENTIVISTTSAAGNYLDRAVQNYGIMGAVTLQTYTVSSIYENAVTLSLAGETKATVESDELTYTLSAANTNKLATATVTFSVEGSNVASASVEGLNDWFVISQSYKNGVLIALIGNNNGISGEAAADIASVQVATTGKTGNVTVTLTNAVLSSFNGPDNEAFTAYVLDNASVTTEVQYSIYDVNQDGTVNQLDITRAQRAYGATATDSNWNALADVDRNGTVDINDLILILNNYSK